MPPRRVKKTEETIEAKVRGDNAADIAGVYDAPFFIYSEEEGERYRELRTKSIEVPTYFNFEVLDQIGLAGKLMGLCRRGKWDWFVRMNYPVYRDLTFEFFTSLRFVSSKPKKLWFRLQGQVCFMDDRMLRFIFGFAEKEIDDGHQSFTIRLYWKYLTGLDEYDLHIASNAQILNAELKLLHKFICGAIFGKRQSTKCSGKELFLLWCIDHNHKLNMFADVSKTLIESVGRKEKSLGMGYLATVLAENFRIDVSDLNMMEFHYFDVPYLKRENTGTTKGTYTSADEPFVVLESKSTSSDSIFTDPLGGISNLNVPKSNKSTGSTVASPLLRPPPKSGQVLKAGKGSDASSIDELDDFATGRVRNKADGHAREERERQNVQCSKFKDADYAARQSQNKSVDDLESFFGMGFRPNNVPKSRATPLMSDPLFDTKVKGKPDVAKKKSFAASSSMKKASSVTNIADDLSSIFGAAPFGGFQEVDGESEDDLKAEWDAIRGRNIAQAVTDMNQREFQTQHEQEERRRIADQMDAEIKCCAAEKEGNMHALLSSLQYVLWSECGWEPVSLTDLVTSTSVKKVCRQATLCVHPDKVQQKGATLEKKNIAEKVFDILKISFDLLLGDAS
ncbi:hypothetical protein K2173_013499 [Erythroxylum novogranatense]|uniref:Arabidopsis retrotransposon Orf1 C-terminal domain-containing protein n=1 Tax=Erythroxylum novogranatense TaxID=1862640 RepID=A0AAV8SAI6_9ROSI|nr:hypothetical protein K2173_013499 [Erythroxylum novogranatense]